MSDPLPERQSSTETSFEVPKTDASPATTIELAEGLDQDSRFDTIRAELINDWAGRSGRDILSAEGQGFQFGDPTAFQRGQEPLTLEDRTKQAFAERFPSDAEAYAQKEIKRIYENPADDPAIVHTEREITRITNQDVGRMEKGSDYTEAWNRNFNRVNMQQWNSFLSRYPEKSAAYREKFEPIKRTFEGQERLRQYQESVSKKETATPSVSKTSEAEPPALEAIKPEQADQGRNNAEISPTEASAAELTFAQKINDYDQIANIRETLGQQAENSGEEEQGEDLFAIVSSLRRTHRFEIHSGMREQKSIEVRQGEGSVVVIETDAQGNSRRWEVTSGGRVNLTESKNNYDNSAEEEIPGEAQITRTSGRGAMAELKSLLKAFAGQINLKSKTRI